MDKTALKNYRPVYNSTAPATRGPVTANGHHYNWFGSLTGGMSLCPSDQGRVIREHFAQTKRQAPAAPHPGGGVRPGRKTGRLNKKRVWLWWSSGKDSAWALHFLRQQRELEVHSLVTTVNEAFDRVAMHAVRLELLQRQAEAARLPLRIIKIPHPCSNSEYEQAVATLLEQATQYGVHYMAFGDLFLQDVRRYREQMLNDTDISPLFPLWGMDTSQLSQSMIRGGLRAYITCIDPRYLSKKFIGREYNSAFLEELPKSVDPCGENGEFHTFAFAGPMFSHDIKAKLGEIVGREGFIFADLQT